MASIKLPESHNMLSAAMEETIFITAALIISKQLRHMRPTDIFNKCPAPLEKKTFLINALLNQFY